MMFTMPELPPRLRWWIEVTNPIPEWAMLFITAALIVSLVVWAVS